MAIKLIFKSNKRKIKRGQKIHVELILKNTGENDINICKIWSPGINIRFKAIIENKELMPISTNEELATPERNDFIRVKPSEIFKKNYELSKLLNFELTGVYNIKAFYQNMYDYYLKKSETLSEENKRIQVKNINNDIIMSNEIKIEVVD